MLLSPMLTDDIFEWLLKTYLVPGLGILLAWILALAATYFIATYIEKKKNRNKEE